MQAKRNNVHSNTIALEWLYFGPTLWQSRDSILDKKVKINNYNLIS